MFTDSIDTFVALIIGSGCLTIIMVWLDRRLTRRRSLVVNRRYGQRLHEGRKDSRLHLVGSGNRNRRYGNHPDLVIGPETVVRKPGLFSKQRVVTDRTGRVVATHYEALVINDLSASSALMLTA